MKTILKILTLFLLLLCNRINAQCGLTINYNYLSVPCDTMLHNINIGGITGSTCTSFSILWENASTGMYTQLDTGYHYLHIWDCFGCETIDTFLIGCAGWNGSTNIENTESKAIFNIQPNPSTELITVKTNKNPINRIFIYSASGQLIKEFKELNVDSFQINIANFESGVYFLKIENGDKFSIRKFVRM